MELLRGVLGSLRPAVVAMIASAGILILISAFWGSASAISFEETKWSMVVIFILCVISLRKTKINPVWVMVLAGLMKAGLALTNGYKNSIRFTSPVNENRTAIQRQDKK